VLAEFLVAEQLGLTGTRRKGWDNYDLLTKSGLRVEVKASGYLQGWAQATHSRLNFGRVVGRPWDENTNEFGAEPEVRADVFVFAVQTCRDHASYDALDVGQWEFYVVPAGRVQECGQKSVSVQWVRQHAQAIPLSQLTAAVDACGGNASSGVNLPD
jgi:hypothetical protein